MGYFGGLGAGKGWLKFLFLVEAETLHEVLENTKAKLVINNRRVMADYVATSLEEYIDSYSRYVEAMLESKKTAQKESSEVYIGLVASLGQISTEPCPDKKYKLIDPRQPVVNFAPGQVYYDSRKGQLCTNVFSEIYFGVEMSYPRVFSSADDRHEVLHQATSLPNHRIFEQIKSRIQEATSPCHILSPSRTHRTQIRITDAMRDRMKEHQGLRAAKLEVV